MPTTTTASHISNKRVSDGPTSPSLTMKRSKTDNHDNNSTNDPNKAVLIELLRLLHAMEHNEEAPDRNSIDILMRADRAQNLFPIAADLLETPDQRSQLETRVRRVCQRAAEIASIRKEQEGETIVERIFRSTSSKATVSDTTVEEGEEEGSDVGVGAASTPARHKAAATTTTTTPAIRTPSIQELQKSQREQMEEAISHMASQMKSETARIHSTLQVQTNQLNGLEDVATDNVEQVTAVAQDVKHHVTRTWNRTIGTWTMIFTMVGAFVLCLVTIQMVPKRTVLPCLFFCGNNKKAQQFCRTLPNGQQECMDANNVETFPPTADEAVDKAPDVNVVPPPPELLDCEMDRFGNCLADVLIEPEIPTDDIRDAILREYMENVEAVRAAEQRAAAGLSNDEGVVADPRVVPDVVGAHIPPHHMDANDETDAFGIFSEFNVKPRSESVPILDGRPFSARDVRKAASNGDADLLARYLGAMPDYIDKVDKNGWTSLHLAGRGGEAGVVQVLMASGCNVDLKTFSGETALDIAMGRHGESHPVVMLLRGVSASQPVIHEPEEEPVPMIFLVDVHNAAVDGNADRLRELLRWKPEFASEQDQNRWSALHIAARGGHTECVRALIEAGGDVSLRTNSGMTPLELLIEFHGREHPAVQLLEGI